MSIKEILHKIKSAGANALRDDLTFFLLLLVSISLVSFGLGRYSVPVDGGSSSASVQNAQTAEERAFSEEVVHTDRQFVGSKNSDKYHLPWCSGAQRIAEENKVWFASVADATDAGYTPAQNCEGL